MTTRTRCQCPNAAYDHSAGACRYVGYIHVRRDSHELWLCDNCTLPGDVRLGEAWDYDDD